MCSGCPLMCSGCPLMLLSAVLCCCERSFVHEVYLVVTHIHGSLRLFSFFWRLSSAILRLSSGYLRAIFKFLAAIFGYLPAISRLSSSFLAIFRLSLAIFRLSTGYLCLSSRYLPPILDFPVLSFNYLGQLCGQWPKYWMAFGPLGVACHSSFFFTWHGFSSRDTASWRLPTWTFDDGL